MMFREKLRMMRKQLNLTQQQIATVLGIDRSAYSYYESGKSSPPMDKMLILAKIFNCTLDELVCADAPKNILHDGSPSIYERYTPAGSAMAGLPKDEQDLLILYRSMSESMCADVLKYMRNLLKLSEE